MAGKGKGKQRKGKQGTQLISWKDKEVPVLHQGENPLLLAIKTKDGNACWAFSLVVDLSLQSKIEKGSPLFASVQHLINHCCSQTDKRICAKKIPQIIAVLEYIKDPGVSQERHYMTHRSCLSLPPVKDLDAIIPDYPKIRIKDFRALEEYETNFSDIQKLLVKHVILGCIDMYSSFGRASFPKEPDAVYLEHSGTCLNGKHCVVIIGCGKDRDGNEYYEFQNSWGETWGNKGYGKIRAELVIPFAYVEGVYIEEEEEEK